ncbi:MAG: nucleotidyltransferase family protein [Thaumarchaeota archaeon]|nr:nucleotidyltransferase family protein [Nitrososphaerota archaeon]
MATVGVLLPANGLEAATAIILEGDRRGVRLRLFGGIAFKAICASANDPLFERSNKDIDIFGRREDAREIMRVMVQLGYRPREVFNRLSMGKRLIYYDVENRRRVDIFLDEFEMCHKFDFKSSLSCDGLALPITDLLMTKLQVVEITEKEFKDLLAAFADFDVSADEAGINARRLSDLCSKDWGVYKTFTTNLQLLRGRALQLDREISALITSRIDRLLASIDSHSKTLAWRIRAKIGEKARWYQLPDQDTDVIT